MMSNSSGFDDLDKGLKDLSQRLEDLGNTRSADLTDILTPAFVSEHTRFANVTELFTATGFEVETQEDFEAIPESELDTFIRSESSFSSWQEMLNAAGEQWAVRKLGL